MKNRLSETGISYELFEINLMSDSVEVQRSLNRITENLQAPYLFINGKCINSVKEFDDAWKHKAFDDFFKSNYSIDSFLE